MRVEGREGGLRLEAQRPARAPAAAPRARGERRAAVARGGRCDAPAEAPYFSIVLVYKGAEDWIVRLGMAAAQGNIR